MAARNENLITDNAAAVLLVKAQTMRKNYCLHGHYLGVKPIKLPNRRLAWPADQIAAIAAGKKITPSAVAV